MRYAVHPMEQHFRTWDNEFKRKRDRYWSRLKTAFDEYMRNDPEGNFNSFKYYMEQKYGLRVNMVSGNIDGSYQIVDDAKHTIFLLKYGQ